MTNVTIKRARIEDLETLLSWRMEVLREVFDIDEDTDMSELEESSREYYVGELPLTPNGKIDTMALPVLLKAL